MTCDVDVLIPTTDRPCALAVTLGGLAGQTVTGSRIVIADQGAEPTIRHPLVAATIRLLQARGWMVEVLPNLPRRGVAQQREFLLERARAPRVLFLDDDAWLEPQAVAVLNDALRTLRCGFVGFALQGASHLDDVRPAELARYEEWRGPVRPERVRRGSPAWDRHVLHNAANLLHLASSTPVPRRGWRPYKIAWIGGCVLYDRAALLGAGGFGFWSRVPPVHAGEDMVAQLLVMERRGGAGLLPSRAYHLEVPTTVPERDAECYDYVLGGERRLCGLSGGCPR